MRRVRFLSRAGWAKMSSMAVPDGARIEGLLVQDKLASPPPRQIEDVLVSELGQPLGRDDGVVGVLVLLGELGQAQELEMPSTPFRGVHPSRLKGAKARNSVLARLAASAARFSSSSRTLDLPAG